VAAKHPAMTEPALSGVLLFLIASGVLVAGLAMGEMPTNYIALNTKRETAPVTFWALASAWALFAVLGVAIAIRHWGG
jgi:hypothetical protein